MLLISMLKTFNTNDAIGINQRQAYMTSRKRAVYATMGSSEGNFLVTGEFLSKLSTVLQLAPKLKRMLFNFCYQFQNQYTELAAALTLMGDSAMTGVNAMTQFIIGEPLTEAHRERIIWEEVAKFMDIVDELRNRVGTDLWPSYRILNPGDVSLNARNFPHLASCAIAWKKKFGDATFKNV